MPQREVSKETKQTLRSGARSRPRREAKFEESAVEPEPAAAPAKPSTLPAQPEGGAAAKLPTASMAAGSCQTLRSQGPSSTRGHERERRETTMPPVSRAAMLWTKVIRVARTTERTAPRAPTVVANSIAERSVR